MLNVKFVQFIHEAKCSDFAIVQFAEKLHTMASIQLDGLTEYNRATLTKLGRKVEDLDSLRYMMLLLQEVREKESNMEMEIMPLMDMYRMLEAYLPAHSIAKEDIDKKTVLRSCWKKIVSLAKTRTRELSKTQHGFKSGLLEDIEVFRDDVAKVSLAKGPSMNRV